MNWTIKPFKDLELSELYGLLRLRCEIFIVEQVAYQDVDNLDMQAYHMFAKDEEDEIIAYLRIFPHGIVYNEAAIGRVCVSSQCRGRGIASEMLDQALGFIENTLKEKAVHISAQRYLTDFYKSKGFVPIGEGYLEDGIPHISMLRK